MINDNCCLLGDLSHPRIHHGIRGPGMGLHPMGHLGCKNPSHPSGTGSSGDLSGGASSETRETGTKNSGSAVQAFGMPKHEHLHHFHAVFFPSKEEDRDFSLRKKAPPVEC